MGEYPKLKFKEQISKKKRRERSFVEFLGTRKKTHKGAFSMTNHITTPLSCTRLNEEFSLKNTTHFGGANLIIDYILGNLKLPELFKNSLSITKNYNAKYPLSDTLTNYVIANILGQSRIFHMEQLETEPLLLAKTGLPKLPDYTLYYDDLDRFQTKEQTQSLDKVLIKTAEKSLGESCILDFDSTVETVNGSQQGAAPGYNPTKPGRPSYHPLLVFDGLSQSLLHGELRSGDSGSSTGFESFVQDFLATFPSWTTIDYFRFDAGFGGEAIYNIAEKCTAKGYVGKIRLFRDLVAHSEIFPWRRVEYTDYIIEVKSFNHQAQDWNKPRRIVMVRYCPADEDPAQLKLADLAWHTVAMVTNLDWDEEDIWHFYNQRCCQENYIKEMKYGFAVDQIPTDGFYPNYAALLLKGIAYNIMVAFRKEIATDRFQKMTLGRLRRELLLIPGKIVKHARQFYLKLHESYRWQFDFWIMRQRLSGT